MQTTKKDGALLQACVAALGAFIERDCALTRKALADARQQFRDATSAELGALAAQQPAATGAAPVGAA